MNPIELNDLTLADDELPTVAMATQNPWLEMARDLKAASEQLPQDEQDAIASMRHRAYQHQRSQQERLRDEMNGRHAAGNKAIAEGQARIEAINNKWHAYYADWN